MNTNADPEGLVLRGNVRVLQARFNDARFFWQMDQHKTLADRVADLANVTFQAKLGSSLEKTKRTQALARELAGDGWCRPGSCRARRDAAEGRPHDGNGEGIH